MSAYTKWITYLFSRAEGFYPIHVSKDSLPANIKANPGTLKVEEYARLAEQTRTEADARIDAQAAEIARLREAIGEAIRLLGMDRPIDPTDVLRAAPRRADHG